MKLNLRDKVIKLESGVEVTLKPLGTGAFQEWMDFIVRKTDGKEFNLSDPMALAKVGLQLAGDKEYGQLGKSILKGHVKALTGLEVEDESGTRPGTIDDLLDNAQGFTQSQILLTAYVTGNMITEQEAKN